MHTAVTHKCASLACSGLAVDHAPGRGYLRILPEHRLCRVTTKSASCNRKPPSSCGAAERKPRAAHTDGQFRAPQAVLLAAAGGYRLDPRGALVTSGALMVAADRPGLSPRRMPSCKRRWQPRLMPRRQRNRAGLAHARRATRSQQLPRCSDRHAAGDGCRRWKLRASWQACGSKGDVAAGGWRLPALTPTRAAARASLVAHCHRRAPGDAFVRGSRVNYNRSSHQV